MQVRSQNFYSVRKSCHELRMGCPRSILLVVLNYPLCCVTRPGVRAVERLAGCVMLSTATQTKGDFALRTAELRIIIAISQLM